LAAAQPFRIANAYIPPSEPLSSSSSFLFTTLDDLALEKLLKLMIPTVH
jgi:hypothetical protein